MRTSTSFLACSLVAVAAAIAGAQAPVTTESPVGKGVVVGTGAFTTFVEDMDRSLAFYHDAFGMDVPPLPASGARAYNPQNPRLFAMFAIPGARERHQSARVPGTKLAVEVMDIQNVDHQTIEQRVQDPGTVTLVLVVRDVDAALAGARHAHATVVTPGGLPVALADRSRAVLIRDLDSRLIELRQPAAVAAAAEPAAGNILDLQLSIAVADLPRTVQIYRDVLGFAVDGDTNVTGDQAMRALSGLERADIRRAHTQAPGSSLRIDFVDYRGVDRAAHRMRIQDRGATRLQLRAQNVDALVDAMKRTGMTVVSDGGAAVPIPPNLKGALVADPDNFFLTPFAPCDGCASGPITAAR